MTKNGFGCVILVNGTMMRRMTFKKARHYRKPELLCSRNSGLFMTHVTQSECGSDVRKGGFELEKFLKSTLDGGLIKLAFEGEVIQAGGGSIGFELDEGHDAGKEVVALGVRPFGG
jgi:hypothetical protein